MNRLKNEFSFIKGNYLLLLIGSLITDFSEEMANTYYPLYFQALGGTATTYGLLSSLTSIISAFVRFPGGYIADKYGRKTILWSMTLLAGFSYLFYAFAPSWEYILLGVVFRALTTIYGPAYSALTMDSIPQEKRGTGYSIINMITEASTTPSPLLAGILFTTYGLLAGTRISFTLVTVTYIIAALLRSRITETIEDPEPMNVKGIISSFSGLNAFLENLNVLKLVPNNLKTILSIQIIFEFVNAMFNIVFVYYIIDVLKVPAENLGIIFKLVSISIIIVSIPCGQFIDRYGKRKSLILSFIILAAGMPLLIWGNLYSLYVFGPVVALFIILYNTSISALYADYTPIEHRGKISGTTGFILLIVISIGRILGGYIYDYQSQVLPLLLFWLSSIPLLLLINKYVQEPEK